MREKINALKRTIRILFADPLYGVRMTMVKARTFFPVDYRYFRSGRALPPVHLTLEVTHRCNLACHMCDLYGREEEIDSIRSRREDRGEGFGVPVFRKLIDSFGLFKPVLSFGGGEPLLHPELSEMVTMAKRRGFTCTVTTNGTLLRDRASGLVEAGLDNLVLSIDGPEKVHDSIRGVPGTFAKAKAGAKELLRIQRTEGRSKPRLRINCTINSRNFGLLSEIVGIAEDFGAESLIFSHLWFWDRAIVQKHNRLFGNYCPVVEQNAQELNLIEPDVLSGEIEKTRGRKTRLLIKFLPELNPDGIRRYYRESTKALERLACKAPWLTAFIMPDGTVLPCLDFKYGNLNERSFGEIWNGDRAREFRRRIGRAGIFPACVRCCMLYSF